MSHRRFTMLLLLTMSVLAAPAALAGTIKDNQGTGQDGFVYTFSAVTFPLSTSYDVTPVGATFTGHDTKALVQFDTTLISPSVTAATLASATIRLHVGDTVATGFGSNPDASHPVTIDAFPLLAGWSRTTLTNAPLPASGSQITSTVASDYSHLPGGATDYWVTLDVTNAVKGWLTNPGSNFGLLLVSDTVVADNPPSAGPYHFAAIDSGFGANSAFAPQLVFNVVAEPSSAALALVALAAIGVHRFRRRVVGASEVIG